jgi:hypothetical protein
MGILREDIPVPAFTSPLHPKKTVGLILVIL